MNHPHADIFRRAREIAAGAPVTSGVHFDAATTTDNPSATAEESGVMTDFDAKQTELLVAAIVQEWSEISEDDLDEGEGLGDSLFSMLVGIADENIDGEIGDDEAAVLDVAVNALGDFLSMLGISDEDINKFLENFDNDVAVSIQEQVISALPEGDDADEMMDSFVMTEGDGGTDTAMDAAYKKKIAFRKGKKTWVNKRISGTVRLSAKRKAGLKKAQLKAHSGKAKMRRFRTMKLRRKAGM